MKSKYLRIFAIMLLLSVCVCTLPVTAMNEHEKPLEEMDDNQLILEAKNAYLNNNESALEGYIHEISKREELYSPEHVSIVLSSTSEDIETKTMFLELYLYENEFTVSDSNIINLLCDENIEDSLKTLILSGIDNTFPGENYDILFKLTESSNGTIAFHALKALGRVNIQQALPLANSILNNYQQETADRVSAAINVLGTAEFATNNRSIQTTNQVIDKLSEIYQNTIENSIRDMIMLTLRESENKYAQSVAEQINSSIPITTATTSIDQIGYAAYRDGVDIALGYQNWHGAIIVSRVGDSQSYAQATGLGYTTEKVTYNGFLGNGTPQGYYRPASTSISSDQRSAVAQTASDLATLRIPYISLSCISFYSVPSSRISYRPTDIKYIRCDGLVEYSFEYNNIRVCGPGSNRMWDISSTSVDAQDWHSGVAAITPKSQAQTYMIRVGNLT